MGKNNTGKTSVLEAVAIYASTRDEISTIKLLLQRRGEFYTDSRSYLENNLNSLSALYSDYSPKYFESDLGSGIHIGGLDEEAYMRSLYIDFRKAYLTLKTDDSGRETNEYVVAETENDIEQREFRYEIKFSKGLRQTTYSLDNQIVFLSNRSNNAPAQFQYVDSKNQTQQSIPLLYSKIALSDKEDVIINALKIVEPDTERFSLIRDDQPIIRLKNGEIRKLSSMGDGVSRVFTIILSMVSSEGTYLLIDEFENGLHYSVQEKLWEIIFYLAERLNIQVFATTHSNDTIKAFGEVANRNPAYSDAQLIQLRNVNDEISAVLFSTQDVEVATETDYLDLR
ncbi:AAA family ATPase [Spirosoma humi]